MRTTRTPPDRDHDQSESVSHVSRPSGGRGDPGRGRTSSVGIRESYGGGTSNCFKTLRETIASEGCRFRVSRGQTEIDGDQVDAILKRTKVEFEAEEKYRGAATGKWSRVDGYDDDDK
jgi:hypothetical protein